MSWLSKEKVLVFAGNYQQFRQFQVENLDRRFNYVYVNEMMDLIGARKFKYVLYGTWYENDERSIMKNYLENHGEILDRNSASENKDN